MDPIAAHLGGSSEAAAGDGPRKKRKKRSSTVAVMGDSSDPQEVEDTWRLRLKVPLVFHVKHALGGTCF